jgi:negative regulator of sigma E activity
MATDLQCEPAMPNLGSKRHSAQPGPTQVKQQRFAQPAHDLKQTQPPVGATAGTTVAMRPVHPAHLCKLNLRNRQRRNLRKLPQVLCMATEIQCEPAMPNLGSKRDLAQPGPTQVKQQRFAQPAHDLKQTQPPVGATGGTTVAMRPGHPAHLCKLNLRNRQRRNLRKLPQVLCMATDLQCEPAMPNLVKKALRSARPNAD